MNTRKLLTLLADGRHYSASALAARLNLSPTDLRRQIEALGARGLPVCTDVGHGHALPWPLELLDAGRIREQLPAELSRRLGALDVLWEVDSTSSELRRRADPADRSCVLAEGQSAGRGRRGRGWLSPPGLNIHFSCLKRFDCGVAALGGLSLAVGVMLMRALAAFGVDGVGLKWPNDVLAGDAKLAGILVELDGGHAEPCRAVVGIGVNLRLPPALRSSAGQAVTDLAELAGGTPPPRNGFAARLLIEVISGLDRFASEGFAAFADEYARHDLLLGRELNVAGTHGTLHGIGDGVDARGALRLRTEQGLHVLDSVEVSVRRA